MIDINSPVLCVEDLIEYGPAVITGVLHEGTDDEVRQDLLSIRSGFLTRGSKSRRFFNKALGGTSMPSVREIIAILEEWKFTCPNGHRVDGTSGFPFTVAIIGRSEASKSHFVPAIPWELKIRGSLEPLGIFLEDPIWRNDGDPNLAGDMSRIYEAHDVLPQSLAADGVQGPFTYRLSIDSDGRDRRAVALHLFDAPGEFFENLTDIGRKSRYIFMARAVILLIDPVNLVDTSYQDSVLDPSKRDVVISDYISLVTRIYDSYERLSPESKVSIPLCVVLGKADLVTLNSDWMDRTNRVTEVQDDKELHEALVKCSSQARDDLLSMGLERLIRRLEQKFHPDKIRYSLASATSENPTNDDDPPRWTRPEPNGIGISMLHLLDMADLTEGVPRHEAD